MKANELRIGNLVYYLDGNGNFYQWEITVIEDGITDDFEPIPLTEEWLVRFGLKLNPNHKAFNIKGMQFEIPSMIGGFYDNEYGLDKESVIELNYVHQLQNLYFALTGEELRLKTD